jgi:hypothetical protein
VKAHFGTSSKGILLLAMVLAGGRALASSKGSLELPQAATIAGQKLASGSYTVRWEGAGDQVQLKIYQGNKVVASTAARVVKVEHPIASDSAVLEANPDGTSAISEIRFGRKKYVLRIVNGGESGTAGGASQ